MLLALDTSADIAVALVAPTSHATDGLGVLAERRSTEQRRHAELLAPMITEVLADAGVDRRVVTAVVVGTGPAPFTGLRAGLVTARTLGLALDVPVQGVCSLDAFAAQAYRDGVAGEDQEVLVVTDARRREVYHARYRRRPVEESDDAYVGHLRDVEAVDGPGVDAPAALADAAAGTVVVGPGAALHPEHLGAAPGAPTRLEPAVLAALALFRAQRGEPLPTEPLYLRRPDVTPAAGRKRATG